MTKTQTKIQLQAVIEGFLRGDSNQFRIIKGRITQYVYHQRSAGDADRDELVSEVLEILYDNLKGKKFRGDSLSALNVYIYRIIKFRIGRLLRSRDRLTYTDDNFETVTSADPQPDNQVANQQMAESIMTAMDPKCRQLLELKFQENWSDQEIADEVSKSKNATSTAITRCLEKARNLDIVKELL